MGRLSPEVRIAQAKLSRRLQIRKSRGGRSIIEAKVQGCSSKGARVHARRAGRFERQTPMSILTLIVECNCSTSNDLRQIAPKILVGPLGSQRHVKGHPSSASWQNGRPKIKPLSSYLLPGVELAETLFERAEEVVAESRRGSHGCE